MDVFNALVLFVIGFFILIKGAQIMVHGAVVVANIFKVSTWFIGVVIVSIGTSIPELSINLASVFSGNDVGMATVLGSNIFNVLFILGIMAVFTPIVMHRSWILRDLPIFIAITALTGLLVLFPVLGDPYFNGITTMEALLMVGVFVIWLLSMFHRGRDEEEAPDFEAVTIFTAFLMVVGGIIGVFFGGNWVVDGSVVIAKLLGVSPAVIGFTVVALGTSLPELVVSIVALSKKTLGIAVGNIVGSSIFNFLGVLGITGLIRPIPVLEPLVFDVSFVLLTAVVWLFLMFVGKKYTLSRPEGVLFLLLYGVFVFSLFVQ